MISGDFTHCTDLLQFYKEISNTHKDAHGHDYVRVHRAIEKALQPGGKRYIELGINQGATLAAANTIEGTLKSCYAYDINIERFDPYRPLFEKRAMKNKYTFVAERKSSTDASILRDCDVLYIDTLHVWNHLHKELNLWADYVAETIICHDTYAKKELQAGIVTWLSDRPEWELKEYNTTSVGYTVLERVI